MARFDLELIENISRSASSRKTKPKGCTIRNVKGGGVQKQKKNPAKQNFKKKKSCIATKPEKNILLG